jgi:hypothetical protein
LDEASVVEMSHGPVRVVHGAVTSTSISALRGRLVYRPDGQISLGRLDDAGIVQTGGLARDRGLRGGESRGQL